MIDTHSHIYDSAFDDDIDQVVQRAKEVGISKILLPAIDSESHESMMNLVRAYPDFCVPMMGVHPTSLTAENIDKELSIVKDYFAKESFCAVGEIGLDLYWSREFFTEQLVALDAQIELALEKDLPVVFHVRDAWAEMLEALEKYRGRGLRGVMHSYSGDVDIYHSVKDLGDFVFGIGGVLTFKKSTLPEVVAHMDLADLVLETDAPYLTPVPFRGKRNESSYVSYVAQKLAQIKGVSLDELVDQTTTNARRIFCDLKSNL